MEVYSFPSRNKIILTLSYLSFKSYLRYFFSSLGCVRMRVRGGEEVDDDAVQLDLRLVVQNGIRSGTIRKGVALSHRHRMCSAARLRKVRSSG